MSLLERVVRAHRCRSTHHYIAFDALSLIRGDEGEAWKSLFLVHHEHLLAGAKAPDTTFRDFKNHVCHVNEGQWGGARDKATEWYARSVELLRAKKWSKAAYALGVLSHYYADPLQPFHTGQTEEEGVIHRAVEWSIAKSRPDIDALIEANGYPDVEVPDGPGFVADMVLAGATLSNAHYQAFIDHYDIHRGVAHPPAGLDDTMREAIAGLIAHATAGFAALVSRAVEEAAVAPPKVSLTLQGYIETLDIPLRWITAKLADMADRAQVERMYREFQKTGKVVKTLPEDDRVIRKLHAQQVLRVPLKELDAQEIAPIGTLHAPAEGEGGAGGEALAEEAAPVIRTMPRLSAGGEDEDDFVDEDEDLDEGYDEDEIDDEDGEDIAEDDDYEDDEDEDYDEDDEFEDEDDEFEDEDDEDYEEDEDDYDEDDDEEDYDDEDDEADAWDDAAAGASGADDGHRHGSSLTRESPVVDAPSIGPKTAARLEAVGIHTVGDLLDCDIEETAFLLDVHYIDSETIRDWQDQTRLMMDVPGLRVHDVQIMVGAGIRSRKELAEAPARTLFLLATEFLNSPEGARVRRGDDLFMEEEVAEWIERAKEVA